jgi:hypothetical protein
MTKLLRGGRGELDKAVAMWDQLEGLKADLDKEGAFLIARAAIDRAQQELAHGEAPTTKMICGALESWHAQEAKPRRKKRS